MRALIISNTKRIVSWIVAFRPSVMNTYATSTTFYMLLSLVPFLIVLISLLQFLPFNEEQLSFLEIKFIPIDVRDFLIRTVREMADNTSAAVLPLASIGTLWSASSGVYALLKGFNAVYRRRETRSYPMIRGLCLLYTIVFLILLIFVLILLVFGNYAVMWLSDMFPILEGQFFVSFVFRSGVTFIVLTFFFLLFYKTIPNRRSRWMSEIPGALFSSFGWMTFSNLYSLYFTHFSNYANIYGSLTAVIFLLIWLYVCIFIMFIGAYINVSIRKKRNTQI